MSKRRESDRHPRERQDYAKRSSSLKSKGKTVSVTNCRASRQREAPGAARTAISLRRAVARARRRFATFEQAITSKRPTARRRRPGNTPRMSFTNLSRKGCHAKTSGVRLGAVFELQMLADRAHVPARLLQRNRQFQAPGHAPIVRSRARNWADRFRMDTKRRR